MANLQLEKLEEVQKNPPEYLICIYTHSGLVFDITHSGISFDPGKWKGCFGRGPRSDMR